VGKCLYAKGYDDEVVEAGLLHDMLEWSSITEKELEERFGKIILELIKANTKDRNIEDENKRRMDQIERSKKIGDGALSIKIADNLDSFQYYSETKNEKELQRCVEWAHILIKNLSTSLEESFFDELNKIIK